jgi:glycosyltransferase involved in cell wall biosynthesis
VHDLCFETHPQFFTPLEAARMKTLVPASCRRADLIFTVSHFVRNQIHDHYDIPLKRIVVTPNAGDHIREGQPAPRQDPADPAPYALYVGLIQPRKNLARVVAAFDRIVGRAGLPHHLILAGARGWGNDELDRAIASAGHRDRIHCLGYCEDGRIESLFANADGFVFPSLFEGFGIPVMEAQRRGVPALASDGSCFPEIYGDSVIYCDPLSVDSIADAMQRLLTDKELRVALVERGRRRAQQFSWERTARIALEGYRRVMASR